MIRYLWTLALVLLWAVPAVSGDVQRGRPLLDLYLPAAKQGDAGAQYNLGLLYANGQGVPQNYTEAANWYRKAAEQGNASAQFSCRQSIAPRIAPDRPRDREAALFT
ncbi:MAG: sel1 repeat family protein [Proteobacteria bacterium]|nr:sel1 repeat family protein [Pseudomonadota bacterium]